MAKNKDINITPSKGISIVIKNDIQQPLPIKPKKKRKYRRINVLPKTPAPIIQQSAGDTSYIKEQPGRFSLWRDNTTATQHTLAATSYQAPPPSPAFFTKVMHPSLHLPQLTPMLAPGAFSVELVSSPGFLYVKLMVPVPA